MKLLKLSFLTLLLILSSSNLLHAQSDFPVKLGLSFSPDISWMTPGIKNYESNKPAMGATVGFIADIYFDERYAFSTGFDFAFLNGSMKYRNVIGTDTGNLIRKYNLIYLEIPTMIKMKTNSFGDFSFYGQIGFRTGFRINAKAKDDFTPDNKNAFSEKNPANDATTLVRESVAIGIGVEYSLDTSSRLFLGLGYNNSLNNILTGDNGITGNKEKAWLNFAELNLGILF